MPGKGEISLTGMMGDVMKESARTGLSYIRSVSGNYGIDKEFFQEHDIHIHIPEGAVRMPFRISAEISSTSRLFLAGTSTVLIPALLAARIFSFKPPN